jgi:hypothetical protein
MFALQENYSPRHADVLNLKKWVTSYLKHFPTRSINNTLYTYTYREAKK